MREGKGEEDCGVEFALLLLVGIDTPARGSAELAASTLESPIYQSNRINGQRRILRVFIINSSIIVTIIIIYLP